MDMMMPEMNGRDAMARIRSIDPAARGLIMTGYVLEDESNKHDDPDVIRKPFTKRELLARVGHALPTKDPPSTSREQSPS
jgi:CheY-like chemotaxis protein